MNVRDIDQLRSIRGLRMERYRLQDVEVLYYDLEYSGQLLT